MATRSRLGARERLAAVRSLAPGEWIAPEQARAPIWTSFRSDDAEQAHAYMSAAYPDLKIWKMAAERDFSLRTQFVDLDGVAVSLADYGGRSRIETLPFSDACFARLHRGGYHVQSGKEEHRMRPGDTFLILPDQPHLVDTDHFEIDSVTLPRGLLEEVAAEATGPGAAPLRFESIRPVSAAHERRWLATLAYLHRGVLSDPQLAVNPLIVGQMRRLLAATALTSFLNTTMRRPDSRVAATTSSVVGRAIAYMEQHAGRDLGVGEIAVACDVDARALRRAFSAALGTSPAAHLRRIRLERAHQALAAADPEGAETVATIARRWGFASGAGFAAQYQRVYGQPPSATLRE